MKKKITAIITILTLAIGMLTPPSNVNATEKTCYEYQIEIAAAQETLEEVTKALAAENEDAKEEYTLAYTAYEEAVSTCEDAKTDYEEALATQETSKEAYDAAVTNKPDTESLIEAYETAYAEYKTILEETGEIQENSYGFFLWMAENEELTESQQSEAATAATVLDGTYTGTTRTTSITYDELLEAFTIGETTSTIENLETAINMVSTGNALRTTDDNYTGLSDLLISPILMAMSELQGNYSCGYIGHCQTFNIGENLAWASYYSYNPYSGWYTDEKEYFDAAVEALEYGDYKGSFTSTQISKIKSYATGTLGASSVGHYINICSSSYAVTGTAYSGKTNNTYKYCWEQSFCYSSSATGTTTNAYTADELLTLLSEFKAYVKELQTNINDAYTAYEEAYAAYEEAVSAYDAAVAEALADYEEAVGAADFALITYTEALEAVETNQETCENAKEALASYTAALEAYNEALAMLTAIEAEYEEYLENTGHAYETTETVSATCTTDGYITYICSYCGDTYTKTIAAIEHTYNGNICKTCGALKNSKISSATATLSATSYIYSGSAKKPSVTVKLNGTTLTKGTDYTVSYSNNTNAGTATVTITGKGSYSGTLKKTFTINKASQSLTVKYSSSKTVKYSKLKKKAQTVKTITKVSGAKGTKTYTLSSATKSSKSYSSKFSVNKSTGKITVKKGAAKGTYTLKVKVTSSATTNYKKATKTVTIKIKVK